MSSKSKALKKVVGKPGNSDQKKRNNEFHKYMMSNGGRKPSHGGKWSIDDIPF